jgi:type II secretion system protein N
MNWVKRILTFIALGFCLLLIGAIVWVHYYLNSPRMSEKIRHIVSERFFTQFEFDKANINFLSGMRIEGARLLSQEQPAKEYASLEEAILEYSPLSLLNNTIEVTTVRLRSPTVQIEQRKDGRWQIPREATEATQEMILKTGIFRFNIVLNNLFLENGFLKVTNLKKDVLFQAQGVNLNGQLQLVNGKNDAKGSLLVKTLDLGAYFRITNLKSPFDFADSVLKLPKLKGDVHGGTCEGTAQLNTGIGGSNFLLDMTMQDVDLPTLLKAIQAETGLMQGTLQLNLQLTGDLTNAYPMQGSGRLEIGQTKLTGIVALDKLGELLNLAQLRDNQFDSIHGSFKVAEQKITFYELEAKSKNLSLTGTGSIGFDRQLDFDVLLILSPELAAQIPPSSQARFGKRENGSRVLTFKLSGTLDDPISNLSEKLSLPVTTPESTEQVSHSRTMFLPVSTL